MTLIQSDSDSDSDSDSTSCSQSQYILGFDDGKIKHHTDLTTFSISRIAGKPVLPPLTHTIIPQSDLQCLNCHKLLPLLLQVYCVSLQNPSHDRVLYLFGCPEETCQSKLKSKSVRGFKSWKFNQEYHEQSKMEIDKPPEPELGENPFKLNKALGSFELDFENPFSTGSAHPAGSVENVLDNPFSKLTLTSTTSVEKKNSSLIASLPTLCSPPHYLTTSYEVKPKSGSAINPTFQDFEEKTKSTSSNRTDKHKSIRKNQNNATDLTPSHLMQPKDQCQESYEVQIVKGVDPAFLDFQERVDWNNQSSQIVRYNPNGRPLLINSELPSSSISRLKCGHESKFELQLMPACLKFFSKSINWTTVWLNDCINDCPGTDEGWVEVQCFVQSVD